VYNRRVDADREAPSGASHVQATEAAAFRAWHHHVTPSLASSLTKITRASDRDNQGELGDTSN
jgi:hypothetical protein